MRGVDAGGTWLTRIAVGSDLPSDDLFGQLNKQALRIVILQPAKNPQQALFEQRLQRFIGRASFGFSLRDPGGSVLKDVARYSKRIRDLPEAAEVDATRSVPVGACAECFGEVILRKPERKPSRLHELIDLTVCRIARHGFVPVLALRNIGTILGRDTFLKPANRFTNGSASL
jgi:hypothetical protein